ncbi:hypothetical protein CHUAL_008619 [Chamberlinius hualienensis]
MNRKSITLLILMEVFVGLCQCRFHNASAIQAYVVPIPSIGCLQCNLRFSQQTCCVLLNICCGGFLPFQLQTESKNNTTAASIITSATTQTTTATPSTATSPTTTPTTTTTTTPTTTTTIPTTTKSTTSKTTPTTKLTETTTETAKLPFEPTAFPLPFE